MFKVATMEHYIGSYPRGFAKMMLMRLPVMATGPSLVRELAKLPDDIMSFPEAIQEASLLEEK
jgi:hypothetical protein